VACQGLAGVRRSAEGGREWGSSLMDVFLQRPGIPDKRGACWPVAAAAGGGGRRLASEPEMPGYVPAS